MQKNQNAAAVMTQDEPEAANDDISWEVWREQARAIYDKILKGFPGVEMKAYWKAGMSPQEACDKAQSRRKPRPPHQRRNRLQSR